MVEKKFKKVFLICFILFILIQIFNVKVDSISMYGNTRQDDNEIYNTIFKNEFDKRSIVIYIKNKFFKHKKIKYVEDYQIEFITPKNVVVLVNETEIIGYIKYMAGNYLFDKNGVVCELSNDIHDEYVEIRGINFKTLALGEQVKIDDEKVYNAIMYMTKTLHDSDMPKVVIDYNDVSNIVLYVSEIEVRIGNEENLEFKMTRLLDIYKKISNMAGTLDLSNAKYENDEEGYIFKKR